MAQFLRPISDTVNTTAGVNGTFADIDEIVFSDADFVYGTNNSNEVLECLLTTGTDPAVGTGHIMRWRQSQADSDAGTPAPSSGGTAASIEIDLYQGATLIATGLASTPSNEGAFLAGSYTLSAAEANAITDYSDLRLHVFLDGGGGNPANRRSTAISWFELEIPDAPAGSTLQLTGAITPGSTTAGNVLWVGNNQIDDFNRADGTLGANWTDSLGLAGGTVAISGNTAVQSGGTFGVAFYNGTFGPLQYSEATFVGTPGWSGVAIRADVDSSMIWQANGTTLQLIHRGPLGTISQGSIGYTVVAGDRIRAVAAGSEYSCYINDVLAHTITNATRENLTGNPGIMCQVPAMDDWAGGAVLGGTTLQLTGAITPGTATNNADLTSTTAAERFINAVGTLTAAEQTAITNLVDGLTTNGLWNKLDAIYPVIGGTEAEHKWNLKDPRDADDAFRLSFFTEGTGSITHDALGMKTNAVDVNNGAGIYTHYLTIPHMAAATATPYNLSLSQYNNNNQALEPYPLIFSGLWTGTGYASPRIIPFSDGIETPNVGDARFRIGSSNTTASNYSTDGRGFFVGASDGALSVLYHNGAWINQSSPSTVETVATVRGFSINGLTGGTPPTLGSEFDGNLYGTSRVAFFSIGNQDLTSTDVANFNTVVEAYQVELGRNAVVASTLQLTGAITPGSTTAGDLTINDILNGIIAAWDFEQTGTFIDLTGNGKTLTGVNTTQDTGPNGNAAVLNGTDAYIYRANDKAFTQLPGITVVIDYYPTQAGEAGTSNVIGQFFAESGDHLFHIGHRTDNTLRARINSTGADLIGTQTMTLNTWHRIVMRWADGEPPELKFDGNAFEVGGSNRSGMFDATLELNIGMNTSYSGESIRQIGGRVDNVFIWDRKLSDAEVSTLTTGNPTYVELSGASTLQLTGTLTPGSTTNNADLTSTTGAERFINAVGTLTAAEQTAITNLYNGFITNGTWTKYKTIYPLVGGTAEEHKWNLKDPQDTDGAFRITWNGGVTHDADGVTFNGSTGYGNTHLLPNTTLSSSSYSFGVYYGTMPMENTGDGVKDGTGFFTLYPFYGSDDFYAYLGATSNNVTVQNTTRLPGMYAMTQNGGTTGKAFENGLQLGTTATGSNVTAFETILEPMYIGAVNRDGTVGELSTRNEKFWFIADGLTDQEIADDYTVVEAYETELGRGVGGASTLQLTGAITPGSTTTGATTTKEGLNSAISTSTGVVNTSITAAKAIAGVLATSSLLVGGITSTYSLNPVDVVTTSLSTASITQKSAINGGLTTASGVDGGLTGGYNLTGTSTTATTIAGAIDFASALKALTADVTTGTVNTGNTTIQSSVNAAVNTNSTTTGAIDFASALKSLAADVATGSATVGNSTIQSSVSSSIITNSATAGALDFASALKQLTGILTPGSATGADLLLNSKTSATANGSTTISGALDSGTALSIDGDINGATIISGELISGATLDGAINTSAAIVGEATTGTALSLTGASVTASGLLGQISAKENLAGGLIPSTILAGNVSLFYSVSGDINSASVIIANLDASVGTIGFSKIWTGAGFELKPAYYWNGSTWVQKPLKYWNGSAWV